MSAFNSIDISIDTLFLIRFGKTYIAYSPPALVNKLNKSVAQQSQLYYFINYFFVYINIFKEKIKSFYLLQFLLYYPFFAPQFC